MASRLTLRLVFVAVVFLFAFQLAFQPIRFQGWTPTYQKPAPRVNLGLDLQGGTHMLLEARSTPQVRATPDLVDAAMRIIANRIDQLGVAEPTVQRQGTNRIIIELPGIHDPQRAIDLIGKTALLEFVDTGTTSVPAKSRWSADGKEITLPDGKKQALEKKVIFTGRDLAKAQATIDETEGAVVNFEMTGAAAKRFEDYTGKNIGRYLTIVLDNEVISSPVIRSAITGGRGQISGGFTLESARDLAVLLRGGALPVPVEIVERRSVGPTLGRDSLDASLRAGVISIVLVLLFMVMIYTLKGVLANIALAMYALLLLAILVSLRATMTLPGIAAFIMTVGMAIDANVLIFERIKEEMRSGKALGMAIRMGWDRAFSAILDSNVTTLIGAVVLFSMGTGPIKGFGLTLIIGVLASMFTAIIVTRIFVDAVANTRLAPWLGERVVT